MKTIRQAIEEGIIKLDNFNVIYCDSRDDWLDKRVKGIGASECASVLGQNPYLSNIELYKRKVGKGKRADDLSDNKNVLYGTKAEKHLTALFSLKHDEYEIFIPEDDKPIIFQSKFYPYIYCTLDGIILEKKTGRIGVYEGKTTHILSSQHKEKWEQDSVPQNYYCQVLHQLFITAFDFAILNAELRFEKELENGRLKTWSRTEEYYFERNNEIKEEIKYLIKNEIKFWVGNVEKQIEPPLIISFEI